MACFDDYILVRGACSGTPSSGLYVNDLPGITLKKAANVSDEEKVTGVNLLNDSVSLAIELTKKDIMERMADFYKFHTVYDNLRIGDFDFDNYQATDSSFGGITSELDCTCRLLRQKVVQIDILLNTTISDKTVRIVDGATTSTYTFDATAGNIVSVYPNYEAVNETIEISIDRSDVAVNDSSFSSFCFNCGCRDRGCTCDCRLTLASTGSGTYGLRPIIHTICSEDAFFCEISHLMGRMVWYHAGIIFVNELLATNRINVYTIYDVDKMVDMRDKWQEEYDEIIDNVVKRSSKLLSTMDSCCIVCDSSRWTEAVP